ncbi:MAG: hypothetical protein ACLUD2_06670 [Clostridium sp.]
MNRNWKQIWIRFAMVLMLAVAIPFQSFAGMRVSHSQILPRR